MSRQLVEEEIQIANKHMKRKAPLLANQNKRKRKLTKSKQKRRKQNVYKN